MRIIKQTIKAKIGDVVTILPIGDTHDDATAADIRKLHEDIEHWSKQPDTYAVGMGDFAEWIGPKDKRHAVGLSRHQDVQNWKDVHIKRQAKRYGKLKWLVMLEGNHELKETNEGSNPMQRLCERLGVPFGGYSTWLYLKVVDPDTGRYNGTVRFLLNHGNWGGEASAGYAAAMRYAKQKIGWDFFFYGHNHYTMWRPLPLEELTSAGSVLERVAHVMATGTFLNTHHKNVTTYSERAGYPATYTGITPVQVQITRDRRLKFRIIGGDRFSD